MGKNFRVIAALAVILDLFSGGPRMILKTSTDIVFLCSGLNQ